MLKLYSELGRYAVKMAIERGSLKKNDARKIIALFNKYQKGLKV